MGDIAWIQDLTSTDIGLAGPKIAKLGELGTAGVRVPRGFVVTTGAYQRASDNTDAPAKIDALIDGVAGADSSTIRELAKRARDVVSAIRLPVSLRDAIGHAYGDLCGASGDSALPTAVRSSATGEDAADASFAGQFDSYLGVTGASNVIDAVRSCWASLFTERAIIYRAEKGIRHHDCPMAVGVLELVDARASGVAFSVHPVTGRDDRIVIEGSWGWGEAIVGGLVTPDRAEVGKSDNRILDYVVSDKTVMSDFDREAAEVLEVAVPPELRTARALSDEEVLEISDAVQLIERHFGHAVDVEWVASPVAPGDSRITIVQARPETVHAPDGPADRPEWSAGGYALKYAFGEKPK